MRTPEEQYHLIISTYKAIPMDGSISVLTGNNGTGKSLLRSQLSFRTKEANGKNVVHASMALRTGLHSHLGGLGVMLRDAEWNATSYSTFHTIKQATRSIHGSYLCLDEIEIGCSRETIMGMTQWLNDHLRKALKGTLGCLVITHSDFVVRNLDFDHWFNLDGYETAEAWLDREIKAVDMEKFVEQHGELSKFIQSQMIKVKK